MKLEGIQSDETNKKGKRLQSQGDIKEITLPERSMRDDLMKASKIILKTFNDGGNIFHISSQPGN